jgi:hypothetical protein
MSWVKRNLYFLIGTVLAVALLGLAGWYFYSKWQLNNVILDKLNADYAELARLNGQKPHPGSGNVNNIETAKEQQKQLRAFVQRTRTYFQSIPRIPDLPHPVAHDFSSALSRTIDQMRHDATNASVNLTGDYNFSFEAQKGKLSFPAGSLEPLSVQLGEVKVICDVLFHAKVNSLDSLRRERVSPDDAAGNQTDYLVIKSVTNEMGVLTPYEITFRSFTPELALVLAGFASSPFGLVVKTINVEPGPAAPPTPETPATPQPVYIQPTPVFQPTPRSEEMKFRQRYGLGPSGAPPPPPPPQYVPAPVPAGGAPATPRGLPTVLDERQLKITIMLNVVKLTSPK